MATDPMSIILDEYPEILEVNDFCKILRIGKNSAYKILESRAIPAFRVGSSWKITKSAMIEFLRHPVDLMK